MRAKDKTGELRMRDGGKNEGWEPILRYDG